MQVLLTSVYLNGHTLRDKVSMTLVDKGKLIACLTLGYGLTL